LRAGRSRLASDRLRHGTAHFRLAIVIGAAASASCATPLLTPGEPLLVQHLKIAPYESHERCASVRVGDRLEYWYESSAPLHFDLRYREDNAVLAPVVRDGSTGDSGLFEARVPATYCLAWEAGAPGAILDYRVVLRASNE
jgi:hypothetical protein